jgi:GMP reductase
MDTVGTFEMARALSRHRLATALHKHYDEAALAAFFGGLADDTTVFYSMGITREDYDKFRRVKEVAGDAISYVCVDVANGYTKSFVDFLHKLRSAYPASPSWPATWSPAKWPRKLILDGADIVKVGIGPGSVCTTRKMTGVGYPQLSAIIECADAAHGLGGLICADGGCTSAGDLAKAFGGGADFVMLGGMLAGHDECMGEVIERTACARCASTA